MIARWWLSCFAIGLAIPIFPALAFSADVRNLHADQILHVESYVLTPSSQTQDPEVPEFSAKLAINGSPSPSSDVTSLLIYFYPENSAKIKTRNSYDASSKAITANMRLDQLPAFLSLVQSAIERKDVWCQWQSINAYVDCHGPQQSRKAR
jgi:hypothetical protein